MTAHDAYLEATRQEDGLFSTLYDNMQSKILEAAQNKKFQVGMSVYSTLEELFEALNKLENDGFETTVRIYKYDEKQLPYVETNISIYWCNEFRD
jgi:hypothetical protein